jgi:hypothetical protein
VEQEKTLQRLSLDHADAAKYLRPTFALVYYTVQGGTLKDRHVTLLDTAHSFFTMRHLNVGLGRVTHGSFVHIPTPNEENALLYHARRRWLQHYPKLP